MKHLRDNIYFHKSYITFLDGNLKSIIQNAMKHIDFDRINWNVLKVSRKKRKISLLWYPNFDNIEHPPIRNALIINHDDYSTKFIRYRKNPPILHRKESFVPKGYKNYERFRNLTRQEEAYGLYNKKCLSKIGREHFWRWLLKRKGLKIVNHSVLTKDQNENHKI